MRVENLRPQQLLEQLDDLSLIFSETVGAGGAIGFLAPLSQSDAKSFLLNEIIPHVEKGRKHVFAAFLDGKCAGTVQLVVPTALNQPHRCEVAKLAVAPKYRRRKVAFALMRALEEKALELGKTLITLDTKTGDPAFSLYRSLSYEVAGVIPDYAVDTDGHRLHSTTYMYKRLSAPGA